MNRFKQAYAPFVQRAAALVFSAAVLLAAAGCVTQTQVKQIVEDSNARLLASQLPGAGLSANPAGTKDDDVAGRIEDFIAAHPDQKTLNGSLRVRQAIVYLSGKQYNLAEAAFKAAKEYPLPVARDAALVDVHESLVWWYENSDQNFGTAQMNRATAARKDFNDEATKRQASADIRDFLAETGAWIGLKQTATSLSVEEQKRGLESTFNDYAFIFDAQDLAWLCNPPAKLDVADLPVNRRRLRAETVLNEGAKIAQRTGSKPVFAQPVIQELVAPQAEKATCNRRFPKQK